MKLEDIGFYTLSNKRAISATHETPLQRCEILLSDRCNFKCPYCRGMKHKGDLSYQSVLHTLTYWISQGLRNVRFSGGEPTLYKHLPHLVELCKDFNVEHIAISTNGSADIELYKKLINNGVNDFSISLDACCASTGDKMAGIHGSWNKVINNIELLSKLTYVTVGIVINENNIKECEDTIKMADELGVSDIRVIPSAQFNKSINLDITESLKSKYPILSYRLNSTRHVRGIGMSDSHKCRLALDDMAVMGDEHYPCIIWLREGGEAIGKIGSLTRIDRLRWYENHNSGIHKICKNNCLDVCVEYNKKAAMYA